MDITSYLIMIKFYIQFVDWIPKYRLYIAGFGYQVQK